MKPVQRSVVALVASVIAFLIWDITMNFRVEIVLPNGLRQVSYPYSGVSLVSVFVAIGLLLFSSTTAVTVPLNRSRKPVLGSALLSGGILTLVFASFWSLSNYLDEQPRCYDFGCTSSTILYYNEVYVTSIGIAIAGIVAILFGLRLLKRGTSPNKAEKIRATLDSRS